MSADRFVNGKCVSCQHESGKHFVDVLGVVRCLHVTRNIGRMSGELNEWACHCVDYAMPAPRGYVRTEPPNQ